MSLRMLPALIAAVALILVGVAGQKSEKKDEGVEDAQLGLSKSSVFDTPVPIVASSSAKEPGENEKQEAYFSGSPPPISHAVEEFLPITIEQNMCVVCHDLPDMIGAELASGDPTPMPATHYTDLRREPGKVTETMIGARFVCTQCHVHMADAKPLVANTYGQ